MQIYDNKNDVDYFMAENDEKTSYQLYGIFKNTENAIMILDYIIINDIKYYPQFGNVIDKNIVFNLYAYIRENLKNEDSVILVIKDVLDNQYKYKIEFETNYNKNSSLIKGFTEM